MTGFKAIMKWLMEKKNMTNDKSKVCVKMKLTAGETLKGLDGLLLAADAEVDASTDESHENALCNTALRRFG